MQENERESECGPEGTRSIRKHLITGWDGTWGSILERYP